VTATIRFEEDTMQNHTMDISAMPRARLADYVERLSEDAARDVLLRLPPPEASAIIGDLDQDKAAALLSEFAVEDAMARLEPLPPNQIADLLPRLPISMREAVLRQFASDLSASVAALLRYPPDSAGGIMDNRFTAVRADDTVSQALDRLRAGSRQREGDVSYIYATDPDQRLVGVVSLRDLVFNPPGARISDIMNRDVAFLRTIDDQEEISRRIQDYPFLGFPVVDEEGRLVGVVRAHEALRVAQTEATEDMQLMVGLSGEERIWTPWTHSIFRRLPWLGVNLGTALGAATVVSLFEETISRWTALVAFVPLICAVAGNAGNQALTVVIRSLALGEVAPGDALRAVRKELLMGAANGLALALAIGLIAFGWKQSVLLGVVAGSAMLVNQVIGALSGVAIPFGLKWFRIDPALASSIFVSAVTDTMGYLVFFGMAAVAVRAAGL
jgi:magnesium transporter